MKRIVKTHLVGTQVQEKSGRVKVKIEGLDGAKWVGRNRHNFMKHHKRELEDNERVYHINGDKGDDAPENLVAIRFSTKVYALKHSRVVWAPKPVAKKKPYFPEVLKEVSNG